MTPWPQTLAAAAALGAGAVAAYALFWPRSTLLGPLVAHGPPDQPRIALTFDDGPWPGATDTVLSVLASFRVPAAFFVIGRYAQRHPALVRRAFDEGHLIGNHTFDHHRTGMFRARDYWNSQISRTQDVIRLITGQTPALFRPPMGFKSPITAQAARRHACRVVTWSWRGFDGSATTPDAIIARARRCVPGDILLLHDGRDPASRRPIGATQAALPGLIESLLARGLQFERLDHLIARIS
ncbi:Peptidoglycan-N-acetylglucosamine deacetylase [Phycisphaerales bacterium]|nr:Peptidoglycan-N-acetylglucosamine deacetylase [Phycisphaerales bacterium]